MTTLPIIITCVFDHLNKYIYMAWKHHLFETCEFKCSNNVARHLGLLGFSKLIIFKRMNNDNVLESNLSCWLTYSFFASLFICKWRFFNLFCYSAQETANFGACWVQLHSHLRFHTVSLLLCVLFERTLLIYHSFSFSGNVWFPKTSIDF